MVIQVFSQRSKLCLKLFKHEQDFVRQVRKGHSRTWECYGKLHGRFEEEGVSLHELIIGWMARIVANEGKRA